jgi:hypothetical protein
MQKQSTNTGSPDTGDTATQQTFDFVKSQTVTSWWQDSHVRLSALLEIARDSLTPGERFSLKSYGFSETKDPDIFCLKTLRVYLVTGLEKLSRAYLGFSPIVGIYSNGRYSIVCSLECRKVVHGYSLSDILEVDVDPKYFLSERAVRLLMEKHRSSILSTGTTTKEPPTNPGQ